MRMAPAAAAEDVALAATSASGRRRRGRQRKLTGWGTVFCFGFGSRRERGEEALAEEGTTTWETWARRRKRTVPVDGDLVRGAADRDATRRGAGDRESRCCFLPGRKVSRTARQTAVAKHWNTCAIRDMALVFCTNSCCKLAISIGRVISMFFDFTIFFLLSSSLLPDRIPITA